MSIYTFILCLFFSCSEGDSIPDNQQQFKFTYLALGDSYTIGEGVEENLRWPNQLKDSFDTSNIIISDVNIIAKTGWTTTNLVDAIADQNPIQHDLVSLLIGVNNQYQNKPFDLFISEFDALITTAQSLTKESKRLFEVSIPDYGVTPFGTNNAEQIGMELDEYNSHMDSVCISRQIPFVNITEISRKLGSSDEALANDNLHPSGSQYSEWVSKIKSEITPLFR